MLLRDTLDKRFWLNLTLFTYKCYYFDYEHYKSTDKKTLIVGGDLASRNQGGLCRFSASNNVDIIEGDNGFRSVVRP